MDDEPMASQIAAHEAYLRALDRLHDAEDSDDQRLRRRIAREVEEARRRWSRLVGDSDRASDHRHDEPTTRT